MWISRVLVLALVATGWSAGAAQAAGETCRGQAATIVGEPHGTVTGTEGADVIVTNGAEEVDAGGGDDTVCVTATPRSCIATVDAGAGDDTVDTTATREYSKVTLGTGADRIDGGNGGQDVWTGLSDGVDAEEDTVHTGGGYDIVTSGEPGLPDADDIDLGAGSGAVVLRSEQATGVLRAAAGSPAVLSPAPLGPGRWVVDEEAEHLTRDGEVALAWQHLAVEYVDAVAGARVRYLGTDGPDDFTLLGGTADGVRLRGGPDTAYLSRGTGGGVVSGAAGRDTVTVVADRVVADLRDGTFDVDHVEGRLREVENLDVTGAVRAVVHGTAGPNFLSSNACTSRIRGGEGDDSIYSGTSRGPRSQCRDRPVDVRVFAGPGDDRLSGGSVNDHLFGGPGDDTADGHRGHDVCRAEERISCEA